MLNFDTRSAQAENFDSEGRPLELIQQDYIELRRVNRWFRFEEPFISLIRGAEGLNKERLEILDIGAGDGYLGDRLRAWAKKRNWDWRFTNLDQHEAGFLLRSKPDPATNVIGSALDLPFKDRSFDVVIASQMTHHLSSNEDVIRHFQEAWRVTGGMMIICDLVRKWWLYCMISLTTPIFGLSKEMREDGKISTLRSFRVDEWKSLAEKAEIPGADIRVRYGSRLTLTSSRF